MLGRFRQTDHTNLSPGHIPYIWLMSERIARRQKARLVQLEKAAGHFHPGKKYSEAAVNEVLKDLFEDHVFARRLLIDWKFLERTADGTAYWLAHEKRGEG